jgi:hypothetical protein
VSPAPSDPQDPFRTDVPPSGTGDGSGPERPPQRPPSRQATPGAPEPDGSTRRQARAQSIRLGVLAVAAVVTALLAPPVGAVLGLVAVVRAARARGTAPTRTRGTVIAAGVLAIVVGVLATTVAAVFREEISQYSQCLAGANTVQARENCTTALNDALTTRLGLAPDGR